MESRRWSSGLVRLVGLLALSGPGAACSSTGGTLAGIGGAGAAVAAGRGGAGGEAGGGGAGGADTSLWTMVRQPATSETFLSVWVSGSGDVYTALRTIVDGVESYSIIGSHDHGATWNETSSGDPLAPLLAVAGDGASAVYAAGLVGRVSMQDDAMPFVAISNDGGATFTPTYPDFQGGINALTVSAAGTLFAVGEVDAGGFLARSLDHGATWTRTLVPGATYLSGVWTDSSGNVYVSGASAPSAGAGGAGGAGVSDGLLPPGVVFLSSDGGDQWTAAVTAPATLWSVSGTADGQRVIAVGGGYSIAELNPLAGAWTLDAGQPATPTTFDGQLGSVFVPEGIADQAYVASVGFGYLLHYLLGPGSILAMVTETLPASPVDRQSGVTNVAGSSGDDVWAVGSGIFHRRIP